MLKIVVFAAFIATAEAKLIRRLHCSPPDAPMTILPEEFPISLAFERPLKNGDRFRFSFVFNSDGEDDSTIDVQQYGNVPTFITLHLRFRSDEKRLVINAHEVTGIWQQGKEKSVPWKDHWRPNATITIEIRYMNTIFEIYEVTPNGAQLLTKFSNTVIRHDMFTTSGKAFSLNAVQLVCV
ncbi:unnamed protein product [Caenorhabditis auriculariae]|uniref:Galectin domain-containing protein n=1 Tax=Caenorhabditis auriculariae TaxID=2777116 RepID=A0A8S1GZ82_9PELO|nr:unnamed protein product [Caenorhabditis auriculariae]